MFVLSGLLSPGFCQGIGNNYNRYYLMYSDFNDPVESQGILRPEVDRDLFYSYNSFHDLDSKVKGV